MMVYLRVCHVRGAWKDRPVRAGRVLQREEPVQEGIPALFRLSSFDCQLVWYHLFQLTVLFSACLVKCHSCPLSELAMLTGQRSTGWYIQEECHLEKSLSRTVFQLGVIFLLLSVSFHLNDSLTLRYSSGAGVLLRSPCLVPTLSYVLAWQYGPTCPGRAPQRGGASPVSCSSTVSAFRRRRLV